MFRKHVTIYGVIAGAGHVRKHMVCLLNLGYDNILYLLAPGPYLSRMLIKCAFEKEILNFLYSATFIIRFYWHSLIVTSRGVSRYTMGILNEKSAVKCHFRRKHYQSKWYIYWLNTFFLYCGCPIMHVGLHAIGIRSIFYHIFAFLQENSRDKMNTGLNFRITSAIKKSPLIACSFYFVLCYFHHI